MALKLGKRPARKGAISFKLGQFIDRSALPKVPMRIGHERIGVPWGLYANDKHACCVFAGAAHEHSVWTHMGGPTAKFTDANVLADYAAVTGFNPQYPSTDQGTDMEAAAQYRRKVGVVDAGGVRHKIDSYIAPRIGNADDLALLTYLTGAVGVGLMLPNSAMDQFDAHQPWDVRSDMSGSAGGHYVACIGRNTNGLFLVISWGRVHAMTPTFYSRYSDESVGYLSGSIFKNKLSPEGFDYDGLNRALALLNTRRA